ncbi:uracil-DNA glycosylase family protein [Oxalobacteraceae bacterium A2-2]
MNRSDIFLNEMGVGVQWKLRHPAPEPAVHADSGLAEQSAGHAPAVELVSAGEPRLAGSVVAETPPSGAVDQAPPSGAAADAMPSDHAALNASAWDDTPAAAPPIARPVPAAPPPAAARDLDESTAWFDDAPVPEAAPAEARQPSIAAMGWTELRAAVKNCTRCELCATRRNAVPGRGAEGARFMAIAAAPTVQDEDEARAITGQGGVLLDNMLKAIALAPEEDVYVTSLVKCRPGSPDGASRAPSAAELEACRPYLERELALTGATQLLTLGQAAAKGLNLSSRGKVHRYGALPVVATYHPDDLLKRPEDKAKAWADLCLARAARD